MICKCSHNKDAHWHWESKNTTCMHWANDGCKEFTQDPLEILEQAYEEKVLKAENNGFK